MKTCETLPVLFLCLVLAGCASSRSGGAYTRDQARTAQTVEVGMVTQVTQVQIEGTKSWIGPLAGATTGGVVGVTIGGGYGQVVSSVVGTLIGGLAGNLAEEFATSRKGQEITVNLDNGRTLAIVQGMDDRFLAGQRVRVVMNNDGTGRVRH